MTFILAVLMGATVGCATWFLVPRLKRDSITTAMFIGITGSIVTTYLGRSFGAPLPGALTGLMSGFLGAALLLAIYQLAAGKR